MSREMYDVSSYSDRELYQLMDLDCPSDRELEAKIHQLLQKYQEIDHPMGQQMYQFFTKVYRRFFEVEDDEADEAEEGGETVVEGFDNGGGEPAPTPGSAQLVILTDKETNYGTVVTRAPGQKAGVASTDTIKVGVNTNFSALEGENVIGYQKSLDYTKGALNPILKETIQRVISIDSQFRDVNVYPFSTDFTFNLSDTLQDVVSLKLYSVQIPYTWYTVSDSYGSNFLYLKGNTAGIQGTGYYDLSINIPSGNYQSADLTRALHTSIKNLALAYPDINFGKTDVSYNTVNSRASFILDIQQIYNESNYSLVFPEVPLPQIPRKFITFTQTPYMYFQCNHPYYTTLTGFNDVSLVIPPPPADSIGVNEQLTAYGYNTSDVSNLIQSKFKTPVMTPLGGRFNFQPSTVDTADPSQNLRMDISMVYQIPPYYYDQNNTCRPNFQWVFTGDVSGKSLWNDQIGITSVFSDFNHSRYTTPNSVANGVNLQNAATSSTTTLVDEATKARISWSYYDVSMRRFYDTSANTYYDISASQYFYDVTSLGIQIQSVGGSNFQVPPVYIPIIVTDIGKNFKTDDFCDLINQNLWNNRGRLAQKFRISINTKPFQQVGTNIVIDTSVSAILTQSDYTLHFYDPIGYPQYGNQSVWPNVQNIWFTNLYIPNPSYDLSMSPLIKGIAPFVDLSSSYVNKIISKSISNTLQEFLGFQSSRYNVSVWKSGVFPGAEFNSSSQFPSLDISSGYLNTYTGTTTIRPLTLGKGVMTVYLYQANLSVVTPPYSEANYTKTDEDTSGNRFNYDMSYTIFYEGLNTLNRPFSLKNMVDAVNLSFRTAGVFTPDSGISIMVNDVSSGLTDKVGEVYGLEYGTKVTGNDPTGTPMDTTPLDLTRNYYYQLKVQFDRKKVPNMLNMKTHIEVHDPTWMSNFHFSVPAIHTTSRDIELSNIVSENIVVAKQYDVISRPYIYLRCITPGYSGFTYNDISLDIPPPPNINNGVGYTLPQYLIAIQTAFNKPEWGISAVADQNGPNGVFRMGLNIQHTIPQIDGLGNGNFVIDFSQSIFTQMNPDTNWVIDSKNTTTIFTNLIFAQTYQVTNLNNRITITVRGNTQGGGVGSAYPFHRGSAPYPYIPTKGFNDQVFDPSGDNFGNKFDNSFYTYLYLPVGDYHGVYDLINTMNTVLFGQNTRTISSYGTDPLREAYVDTYYLNKTPPPVRFMSNQSIDNGRVNLYGSNMSYSLDPLDATKNTLTLKLQIRSILTAADYHLEYYDPASYLPRPQPNISPGMGMVYYNGSPVRGDTPYNGNLYPINPNSSGDTAIIFRYCNINALDTSLNYTAPVNLSTHGWFDISNSWYNKLYIPDPSYVLALTPPSKDGYTYMYGTTALADQKLSLTTYNNHFTITPNYNPYGGVYVTNPSTYTHIYKNANDIMVTLDLPVGHLYNIDDVVNSMNRALTPYRDLSGVSTYGSYIHIDQATHNTKIRLNINRVFTAKDYALTLFEENLFTHCSYGPQASLTTVTPETTLGWLLGFRNHPSYSLDPISLKTYNLINPLRNQGDAVNYKYDETTGIVTITGDTSVSVTLYNYFLIVLDDYTQNHLNDGLVTIVSPKADIPLPSYATVNRQRCNASILQAITSNNTSSNSTTRVNPNTANYIGNTQDPTTYNNLTVKQLYAANQILNTQQNQNQVYQNSLGIYVQDIFGIIPVKTAGLQNGQTYVEFGGTLQNQERIFFGPVNIKRMTVRILTDKGTILNLNNANWSFSLVAQQLYNPNKG